MLGEKYRNTKEQLSLNRNKLPFKIYSYSLKPSSFMRSYNLKPQNFKYFLKKTQKNINILKIKNNS